MSEHTAYGIERNGRPVVDLAETETGARLDANADLDPADLRHVAKLATELAVNAERRAETRTVGTGIPEVTSPWG